MVLAASTVFFDNPVGNWTILSSAITTTGALTFTATAPSGVAVSSGSVPPTQSPVRIDNELLMVTNIASTTWTVTRGIGGTTAATHVINSVVTPVPVSAVLNLGATLDVNAKHSTLVDGVLVGSRRGLNLKSGSGVILAAIDTPASETVDVTLSAPAGSLVVQSAGTTVAAASVMNFVGNGVSVTNVSGTYNVNITGGGGGGTGGGTVIAVWGP